MSERSLMWERLTDVVVRTVAWSIEGFYACKNPEGSMALAVRLEHLKLKSKSHRLGCLTFPFGSSTLSICNVDKCSSIPCGLGWRILNIASRGQKRVGLYALRNAHPECPKPAKDVEKGPVAVEPQYAPVRKLAAFAPDLRNPLPFARITWK